MRKRRTISFKYGLYVGIFALLLACNVNSVTGTVKNAVFFSKSMKDTIKLNLDFKNGYFYGSNLLTDSEEERFMENLIQEFKKRKIVFSNEKAERFTLVLKSAYYSENPSTDTYTDSDGNTHEVNTMDHDFKINGFIIDYNTCQRRAFAGEVSDGTKAGKNIFGMIGEKGVVTQSGMINRGVDRFIGRGVNILNRYLEDQNVGRNLNDPNCENIKDMEEEK